jgi:hypothetical protein
MKRNIFYSEQSYALYTRYIQRVRKNISSLPDNEIEEIIAELDSHIYEALQLNDYRQDSEFQTLEAILNRLGQPESYLTPLIAKKKLVSAFSKYNIINILRAIFLIFRTTGKYFVISILYLFILTFGIVVIAKLLYPQKTGFFIKDGQMLGIGYLYKINTDATELLGYWLIPIMLVLIVLFYLIITFIFRKRIR